MFVTVNVTFDSVERPPKQYNYHYPFTLGELQEHLLYVSQIGHGRFYHLNPDGTVYFIPFSEYSQPYDDRRFNLYYEVYDKTTRAQLIQLDMAIRIGDLPTVQQLVPSTFDVNLITPYDGSLLHRAIVHGQFPIVEYLLRRDANVNLNDGHFLPLSDAIRKRNLPIVRLLVENGAEVNRVSPSGSAIFSIAISYSNLSIVAYLLSVGVDVECLHKSWKPLHMAVYLGGLEMVKMLVEAGANIDSRIGSGPMATNTPLMLAARTGNVTIVRYLLKLGVDAEHQNQNNETAEDIARHRGYQEIVNLIQEYNQELLKEPAD